MEKNQRKRNEKSLRPALLVQNLLRLTGTFPDTEGSVGVLGSGVVLELERCRVVHKRLRALGHARARVVEIGASLRSGRNLEVI